MPISTRELSKTAQVSEQTIRNYTREYGALLSPAARGETSPRLFSDTDVQTLCTIAALRKANVPPAEVIERIRRGDVVIDTTPSPQQATPSPQDAHQAPQALALVRGDLQRQIDALRATQTVVLRAALLWGALLGAITALAGGAFVLWVLWLLAH